jgi:wyosine [tRNA(Phe)-imidazoG37] synthetase (radical SAM superfamily)
MQIKRRSFYAPEAILEEVKDRIQKITAAREPIDYLTFVPDGEPTLDINLGREIRLLKPLGIKIAVISNASLLWRLDVREDLMAADWVSLKIDTVREKAWHKIDRPHRDLNLSLILDGVVRFAMDYKGQLVTETMLVKNINDDDDQLTETADFLTRITPSVAYLSIPTRPPAEKWVRPPDDEALARAFRIFSDKLAYVEYLFDYEGNWFASTGDIENDLLSITAVHPMNEESVNELLLKAGKNWSVVQHLIDKGQLAEIVYKGQRFYLRKFTGK